MFRYYLCEFLIFWEAAAKDHDRFLLLFVQFLQGNWQSSVILC